MRDYPHPKGDAVRSIVLGIIFSILTCGFYTLYWQVQTNSNTQFGWLRRDEYSFWLWFLLILCDVQYL